MKKLSTALTMTLLLGSTLNAASTLQITDGSLTPRSAAQAWIAEKKSGKTPATPASKIHEALFNAAGAAEKGNNPERLIELWRTQQIFTKESGSAPVTGYYRGSTIIHSCTCQEALFKAADEARKTDNPERLLMLWQTQKAFAIESDRAPMNLSGALEIIDPWTVHDTFSTSLNKETNPARIVELFESWAEFVKIEAISLYYSFSFKKPDSFKPKYEAAKKEVEKARSLVPAGTTAASASTSSTTSGELSVKTLVGFYGNRNITTTSFEEFKKSFARYYKTAALRLHPDKSTEDAAEFKLLGAHKDWVELLTEADFAKSPK